MDLPPCTGGRCEPVPRHPRGRNWSPVADPRTPSPCQAPGGASPMQMHSSLTFERRAAAGTLGDDLLAIPTPGLRRHTHRLPRWVGRCKRTLAPSSPELRVSCAWSTSLLRQQSRKVRSLRGVHCLGCPAGRFLPIGFGEASSPGPLHRASMPALSIEKKKFQTSSVDYWACARRFWKFEEFKSLGFRAITKRSRVTLYILVSILTWLRCQETTSVMYVWVKEAR